MPDIRVPARFRSKMITLERKYLREIKVVYKSGRSEMLEILTFNGVKMSTIHLMRNVIDEIGRKTASIGREMSKVLDDIILWYLEVQRKQAAMAGLDVPDIQSLNYGTGAQRKEIYEQVLGIEPDWVDRMKKSMAINLTRLAVANADLPTAVDRLLSSNIADGRASVYRVAGAQAQTAVSTNTWVAGLSTVNVLYRMVQQVTETVYMKQAVAAIDERTTDCCLRVHGQVQPLNKPFILHGTPRFADKIDNPPFHWYCRTSQSLYNEKFESKGVTTEEMRRAAIDELKAREETGGRVPIHPAHSTSGRGR